MSFAALASLSWITVGAPGGHPIHLGHLGLLVVFVAYARWDAALACFLLPLFALAFPFAALCPKPLVAVLASLGLGLHATASLWGAPRAGFSRIPLHAVIAPLFFAASALGLWPPRKAALAL